MRIGMHVKIGQGLPEAVKSAVSYGCNTFQMFSRSPRGGKARPFTEEELNEFHRLVTENKISPVIVHMPYILNLANPDEEMHKYAVRLILEDLERADQLQAQYLVLHVGSHRGTGEEIGLLQMVNGLAEIINNYAGQVTILLENTAGAGHELGYRFEHLAWIMERLKTDKVAVCFDTCHAFGAGYNLVTEEAVQKTLQDFDSVIGLDLLKVIHANDSAYPLGSKKDRHAHIGKGLIGPEGFRTLLHDQRLHEVPFILETPVDKEGDWVSNLKTLRSLAE